MTFFAVSLFILTVAISVYALWLRDWLRSKSWSQPFFEWVEPIEIFLFKKSPTILFARLKVFTGVMLSMLTSLGGIDLTPIMPFVPDKYEPYLRAAFNLLPLIISGVGWMDEALRRKTTLPIELVEVKESTATAEVKVAIAQVQEAKEQAVATVKAAS